MIDRTQEEIMCNWGRNDNDSPLVTICCITYNHSKYIEQCLNGFLMQETTFPFEVLIHDDCSTDGTTEIIKQYVIKFPKLIKPFFETQNQYSKGIRGMYVKYLFPYAKGEFVAICEGDDYWCDKYKLEKQIKFLRTHKEYGLSYTYAKKFFQKENSFERKKFGKKMKTIEQLIIQGDKIPSLTICLRNVLLQEYVRFVQGNNLFWEMGDYPLVLWVSGKTKIKCIKKITSVYRVLDNSASHFRSLEEAKTFIKSANDVQRFFCQYFDLKISDKQLKSIYQYMYIWKLINFSLIKQAKSENKKLSPYSFNSFLLKIYLFLVK